MKTKTIILLMLFAILNLTCLQAQKMKSDHRMQVLKEDGNDQYQSTEITTLDVLHALSLQGIQIMKFDIGKFDKRYMMRIFAETYEDGKVTAVDTIFAATNQYHYFERGEENYFQDYLDQLKFIVKADSNTSKVKLHTYKVVIPTSVKLKKEHEQQFFLWRSFSDSHWQLNKRIPLMVFASSWWDDQYKIHRFCGVVRLREKDKDTEELLQKSPTYIMISYEVNELSENDNSW